MISEVRGLRPTGKSFRFVRRAMRSSLKVRSCSRGRRRSLFFGTPLGGFKGKLEEMNDSPGVLWSAKDFEATVLGF